MTVKVIGAGLAGCEAAWQLAQRGIATELIEMKPLQKTEAHKSDGFAELVPVLEDQHPARVYLQPFMLVAGDHAQNDLAGEDEESWASQLKARGLKVEARLTGLGSLPGIQNIFVRHTAETTDDLVHPAKIF